MNVFFGIGAFQSFVFSLLLISKKNSNTADKYLAGFFFVIALFLANSFSMNYGLWEKFPDILFILTLVPLLFGPLLFCYVKAMIGQPLTRKQIGYHLIPIIVIYLLLLPFLFHSDEEKLLYFTDKFRILPKNVVLGTFIQYLSAPVYFIWIILIIKNHKRYLHSNHSSVDKISMDWMRKLLIGVITIWLIDCVNVYVLNYTSIDLSYNISWYIKFIFMIFIIIIGYYGINQGSIFAQMHDSGTAAYSSMTEKKQNYTKSFVPQLSFSKTVTESNERGAKKLQQDPEPGITFEANSIPDKRAIEIKTSLENYIEDKKAYLNSELRIQDLAVELNIPAHILSHIINTNIGKNFFDFINTYRINEVKKRLHDASFNNHTIIAIAFDCGFNSKATFNRLFKRHTGITPSQFKKQIAI